MLNWVFNLKIPSDICLHIIEKLTAHLAKCQDEDLLFQREGTEWKCENKYIQAHEDLKSLEIRTNIFLSDTSAVFSLPCSSMLDFLPLFLTRRLAPTRTPTQTLTDFLSVQRYFSGHLKDGVLLKEYKLFCLCCWLLFICSVTAKFLVNWRVLGK